MTTDSLECPACGARMRQERRRCLRCGAPLAVRAPASQSAASRGWWSRHKRLLAGTSGVVVAAAVTAYAFYGRTAGSAAASHAATSASTATGSTKPASVPPRPQPRDMAAAALADPAAVARQSYRAGEFEAAYAGYRQAADQNPNDAEALSNCGQALVRMGKPADAVPFFERAIALNDGRWAYHFNLAHASGLLGQWNRAVDEYKRAAELFPDDFATEYNLGAALHQAGDETSAITHLRRATELQPDEADFHLSLGSSCERAGRAAEAVAAFRRYLELAPGAANAAAVRSHIDALSAPPAAPQK